MGPAATPERWRRIEEIFQNALDLPESERSGYIARECGDDSALRAEVLHLVSSAAENSTLIEDSISGAAREFYSSTTLKPGDQLSHYRVISLIGAGGMGRVYLAEDARLGRRVALKTLAAGLARPDHLRRFEQEARSASALNHPNILTIYDVGEARGIRFIASEFIEGKTLRALIDEGPVAAERTVEIATQIAAGLEAAHSFGIAHRDIKPENVIIRPDGLVKLVDFGIARLTETASGRTRSGSGTRVGMVVGTARYMSPEQARGLAVDPRTDIFSAGVVLYEMLAGRAPFEGETDSDLIAAILIKDPPPLESPRIPESLRSIVTKAMAKNADDRFANGGELRAALQQSTAQAAEVPRRAGKRFRRAWIAVAVLVLATAGVATWRYSRHVAGTGAPRTLAILPFRNLRPDPATDFLGFSLADEVITKLSYVGSLAVRPSSAIERYRSVDADPRTAGHDLRVNTLLAGSYLRDGDNLRINAQLIDVSSDRIIWRDSMDVKYQNLLTVQDRVAEEIISGLELRLSPTETRYVEANESISREAYEDYLRGVDLYAQGDYAGAIRVLKESARMQPDYAQTWAHLGRAYTTNASLQFGGREQYALARAAYERALQLDPGLIEPRVYMANLFTDTGLAEQSVPLLRRALEESPNNAEAHWELGYAYRFAGMLNESLAEALKAREIDPAVKLTSSALNTWLYLGKYQEFLATLPDVNRVYILFYRGFGEFYLNRTELALDYFNRAYQLDPAILQAQLGKALAWAILRQPEKGIELLHQTEDRVIENGVADPEGLYKIAQAYAVLGDRRDALHMLEHSIGGGFFCYPYFVTDPLLRNIRGEAEFNTLLERARQRHERFRATFFPGK